LIASTGHKTAHAVRPERRNDTGGATAPIEASQHGLRNFQRIEQLEEVLPYCCLLA
jgi:hypothetical protein